MNRMNRIKLIASGITLSCCAAAVGAVSVVGRISEEAVPAALSGDFSEPPLIILDAGHGEST